MIEKRLTSTRLRPISGRPHLANGDYVLYWMTTARRLRWNFALQRAVEICAAYRKPLLILEALRVDYPDACDRFHAFVIEGMADNARHARRAGVTYYPYIEPAGREGSGLLDAVAKRAVAVVTDWFPAFFIPRMQAAAAARVDVAFEVVDGLGLFPAAQHGRAFPTARGFRAFMQRNLGEALRAFPDADPLTRMPRGIAAPTVPRGVPTRWPKADLRRGVDRLVASLPIDHRIARAALQGGTEAGRRTLDVFVRTRLTRYAEDKNHPDLDGTSRLSPYLHFGHLSVHEVFASVMTHERWTTRKLGSGRSGAREGWWGVSKGAEDFLDQIAVWRELAINGCAWIEDYRSFATLPPWARATLDAHRPDPRPHVYTLEQLDAAATHDPVWNAAQRQLRRDGWFHGYMRMVWGKKILEWCAHPEEALERMEGLMNRYSLDGRDPVSYLNYGWVLGRYDRPWPERPIFGTVRYMTSESARRKLKLKKWLSTYAEL